MKRICQEKIFEPGRFFPQCHASTLAHLPDGSLACAWFSGTREGADDVAITGSIRRNGAWSDPTVWSDVPGIPSWNPVLMMTDRGLTLFHKSGKTIPEWITLVTVSPDLGRSWSPARELIPGASRNRGPVKNKGIFLRGGTLLAPMSAETPASWRAGADRTSDGIHWECSMFPMADIPLKGLGVIQPSFWEAEDGTVYALMRSTEGFLFRSFSRDGGKTWAPAEPTDIPNNNSGIDLVRTDDGRIWLVSNPVCGNWAARTPLSLSVSSDNGMTFRRVLDLETTPGEYSYPAVIAHHGRLFITYTWNRVSISYAELEPEEGDRS